MAETTPTTGAGPSAPPPPAPETPKTEAVTTETVEDSGEGSGSGFAEALGKISDILKARAPSSTSNTKYASGQLKNVGNLIRFSKQTDPNNYTNLKFKRSMKVVDIIPVNFSYNLTDLDDYEKSKKGIVQYYFDTSIKEYAYICSRYGLTPHYGVRAWLTSATTSTDTLSNSYSENTISNFINSLTNNPITSTLKSASLSTGGTPEDYMRTIVDGAGAIGGLFEGGLASSIGSLLSGIGDVVPEWLSSATSLAGSVVAQGKHVALPEIWNSSNYSPNLSLNIKLVSPYGTPEAIRKFIIEPLCYLIILASPRSRDGVTYGYAPYVHVKAYGLTNMNIAVIDRVNWTRGDGAINNCRQPLSVDVTIDLRPAIPGFAVMETEPGITVNISTKSFADPYEIYPDNKSGGVTLLDNIINSFRPVPPDISNETGAKCPDPPVSSDGIGDFVMNSALGLTDDFFSGDSPFFTGGLGELLGGLGSIFSAVEESVPGVEGLGAAIGSKISEGVAAVAKIADAELAKVASEKLAELDAKRKELIGKLAEATEEEREKIAAELEKISGEVTDFLGSEEFSTAVVEAVESVEGLPETVAGATGAAVEVVSSVVVSFTGELETAFEAVTEVDYAKAADKLKSIIESIEVDGVTLDAIAKTEAIKKLEEDVAKYTDKLVTNLENFYSIDIVPQLTYELNGIIDISEAGGTLVKNKEAAISKFNEVYSSEYEKLKNSLTSGATSISEVKELMQSISETAIEAAQEVSEGTLWVHETRKNTYMNSLNTRLETSLTTVAEIHLKSMKTSVIDTVASLSGEK